MRRNYKAWPASVIPVMILCFGCMLFALGQGGTGRETPKANSRKNPPAAKRSSSSRKPRPTKRSTTATNTGKQTNAEPKAGDAVANERTYWETIRLSTDLEDFKAYLKKYPEGQFADLARNSLRRLETARKPGDKTNSNSAPPTAGGAKPAPKPGSIVRDQLGMELVYVPAGSFMMGSNNGPANEKPVHQVTIKEGFYMGRYEVTQAEWTKVMGANPSYFKGDRLPVEQVSWDDAQNFISKLNERAGEFKYRLPTEAEWEYACRAGTRGDYAGDLDKIAWYADNSGKKSHPVGTRQPNAFGLYDMHGNVWEWCRDSYHNSYAGAPNDGSEWSSGGEQYFRVLRGGSWSLDPTNLRSAVRRREFPDLSYFTLNGFRVVAVVRTP
jgi:formylglycine-generating enzyme required for sulfatase activity